MTTINKILSLLLGILFFVSGVTKAIDVFHFQVLLHGYGIQYLDLLAPLIAIVELCLAGCLFLQMQIRIMSLIAGILLFIFTLGYTYGYFYHGITDCGCFGTFIPSLPFVVVLIRNIILLLIANILFVTTAKDNIKSIATWKHHLCIVYIAISCFIVGMTFHPLAFTKTKEHPLQNRPIATTQVARFVSGVNKKRIMLTFFSYKCPHCTNSIENMLASQRYNIVDTIIPIALTKETDNTDSLRNVFNGRFPMIRTQEISVEDANFINLYPTTIIILEDSIKMVIEGEIPSPYVWTEQLNFN